MLMEIHEPQGGRCEECITYSPILLPVYMYGILKWLCVKCRDFQVGMQRTNNG
jgi:hypothetical protein